MQLDSDLRSEWQYPFAKYFVLNFMQYNLFAVLYRYVVVTLHLVTSRHGVVKLPCIHCTRVLFVIYQLVMLIYVSGLPEKFAIVFSLKTN